MPTIDPPGGPVDWPKDEGVIGVVGVAPWATIDFLRELYKLVPATKDWHFPRVLCDVNTKLPSRGRYFELGERDPSPFIKETIDELARRGATVVVVPCNTAHILFDRWADAAPVAIPNIIEVTARAVHKAGAHRVVTLASRSIHKHQVFETALERLGVDTVELDEGHVATVADAIEAVKQSGSITAELRGQLRQLLEDMKRNGADGVILGCTELGLLTPLCQELGLSSAESCRSLAEAALGEARVARRQG